MHAQDIFAGGKTTFSFEFFPPKSPEAGSTLFENIAKLETLKPTFVSVTYGAGGTTRKVTQDLVLRLRQETMLDPMPHLTCVSQRRAELDEILERYASAGISNILALRGDPPQNQPGHRFEDDELQQAAQLVSHIKKFNDRGFHADRRGFGVSVAGFPEGHPATQNRLLEIDHLKAKVDAGADYIVTQLFFDNRDFYDFRDRCRLAGIRVPIVAGILPITTLSGMRRMADLAAGARFPAPLLRAVNRTDGSAESVGRVGVHWATEQSRDLLDHAVDGIHFYTLNKSTATREVYATLGVKDSNALAEVL